MKTYARGTALRSGGKGMASLDDASDIVFAPPIRAADA